MTDLSGLIPIDSSASTIDVSLSLTSVSPASGLNQLGGDFLYLSGSGFDQVADNTSITFSDGTTCEVQSTRHDQIECMVSGFDSASIDSSTPYTLTVSVNGVTDSSQSVNILATKQSGVSVSPSSVSPVLSTTITVTLESTYPHTLAAEDFEATLVDASDSTITRPLYIVSVDDAAKSVDIKFPGAESGSYHVQLSSTQVGRIYQDPLALEVIGKITSFSPQSGSALGGTLVTIDGVNFSDNPLDNPVKVGDNYCLVETTSASQITCRISETGVSTTSNAELLVFLRTSEEA